MIIIRVLTIRFFISCAVRLCFNLSTRESIEVHAPFSFWRTLHYFPFSSWYGASSAGTGGSPSSPTTSLEARAAVVATCEVLTSFLQVELLVLPRPSSQACLSPISYRAWQHARRLSSKRGSPCACVCMYAYMCVEGHAASSITCGQTAVSLPLQSDSLSLFLYVFSLSSVMAGCTQQILTMPLPLPLATELALW